MTRIIFIYISIFISIFLIISSSHSHEINKDNIETIIKNFLKKNPDFVKSTLDNYKISLENKKKQNAIKLLKDVDNPGIFPKQADITIYEFFDYNCGYCKSVMQNIFNIYKKDKKVEIVFVEYPILSNSSLSAAIASLAARNQKKYFEFHSKLMKHAGKIDDKLLLSFAKDLKIDTKKLKSDYSNEKLMLIINKNREIANRLNLRGTPAFIIGNKIYPGAMSEKDIEKAIALERKR